MKPGHVEEAGERVRGFLEVMVAEAPLDQSDEVLGAELVDRWERLFASVDVDRSAARSLLFSSEDVLPIAWRGTLGCRYAFQMGAAVALLARQFADEEAS